MKKFLKLMKWNKNILEKFISCIYYMINKWSQNKNMLYLFNKVFNILLISIMINKFRKKLKI